MGMFNQFVQRKKAITEATGVNVFQQHLNAMRGQLQQLKEAAAALDNTFGQYQQAVGSDPSGDRDFNNALHFIPAQLNGIHDSIKIIEQEMRVLVLAQARAGSFN